MSVSIYRVANSEMKFFSRGFSAKFQGFSRVFFTMFSRKNMIITYRSSVCTHLPFILRFTWNCVSVVGKRGCLPHDKWYAVFPLNYLIDPPPLRYRNKKCNSTARPKIDAQKSASQHNFSGVCCNVRVFQGVPIGKVEHGSTFPMLLWCPRCIADVGTRVFPLKNICLRTITNASQAPSNYMETCLRLYGNQP